ncbi:MULTISPECIES: DUF2254 domain-containing protein [unclassified Neisseria]|uniref:DUF2254 domain-containing protein n=1 Tax=unclassified Neisseria TaxID=2623750 RepID=UPI0026654788|nr:MULTISPECIES: DUF2254 family protein [unclassified Neisseria]MDO1510561.1 DUF2254 family protein [Neisseria sp. MVDL19-042950]MDO1516354.1 DUF2254 family protein [Neisseria sp. MVDL18-041461]
MMMYRWLLALKKPSNRLWVTPAGWAVLAVCFAFAARLAGVWLPPDVLPEIQLSTLEGLLDVIASSMLAVSTFSLSIMVSAFSSAANGATPRATELVMGDDNTRTAIASFISAFIYAIIAKTALGTGFYGQNGRFVLFVSTIVVLVYLIVTLIRWVYTLSQLGRMDNTLNKIQTAAHKALVEFRANPQMGTAWRGTCGSSVCLVKAGYSGYLTHIDMASLQNRAEKSEAYVHILVRPGELLMHDTPLMLIEGGNGREDGFTDCFVFGQTRSYDQDPNWGFIVMSEVAQRALSPAVNDPGTAISVMTGMMRLLTGRPSENNGSAVTQYDRLSIKPLDCGEWVRDGFAPIARDGAGILEVDLVMQKVLAGIWRNAPEASVSEAAAEMAEKALQRALQELSFEHDAQQLKRKHEALFGN